MSETKNDIKETIRAYVVENFFAEDEAALTDDTLLISGGCIDSVAVMVLVDFLEKTFGFEFEPFEVDADNLDSLDKLSEFVLSKQ